MTYWKLLLSSSMPEDESRIRYQICEKNKTFCCDGWFISLHFIRYHKGMFKINCKFGLMFQTNLLPLLDQMNKMRQRRWHGWRSAEKITMIYPGETCCMLFWNIISYTGCHRRNGPNFGRVFPMLNYTDITQNTYIQSWMVTEIMAREKCGHLAFPCTVHLHLCSALTWREHCGTHFCDCTSSAQRDKIAFHYCRYVQCLVNLRTTVACLWVFL